MTGERGENWKFPFLSFFGLLVLQKITRRLLPEWIWLLWREAHEQVVFLLVLTHVLLKQREGCSGETVMSLLSTLRSSTAWPTLILLMAASRLSWSTRSSCCCRPDIWSKRFQHYNQNSRTGLLIVQGGIVHLIKSHKILWNLIRYINQLFHVWGGMN